MKTIDELKNLFTIAREAKEAKLQAAIEATMNDIMEACAKQAAKGNEVAVVHIAKGDKETITRLEKAMVDAGLWIMGRTRRQYDIEYWLGGWGDMEGWVK